VSWEPRRIVTGPDPAGTSIVSSVVAPPVVTRLPHDGVTFFELWSTTSAPTPLAADEPDPTDGPVRIPPPATGTKIRINEFLPGHVRDGRQSPWHRTETVDYGILIEGELVLLLDDSEVTLRPGDVVIQRGTNHAWANRSDRVARIAFVLVDAEFTAELAHHRTETDAARTHVVTSGHNA
jgi:quercetin dioxygenase-like cupin family protein